MAMPNLDISVESHPIRRLSEFLLELGHMSFYAHGRVAFLGQEQDCIVLFGVVDEGDIIAPAADRRDFGWTPDIGYESFSSNFGSVRSLLWE